MEEKKVIDENEFFDIKGYEGLYQINRKGVVKNIKEGKYVINNKYTDPNGYQMYCLYKNKKSKIIRIHALLYKQFVEDYDTRYFQIDHKNQIRDDNRLENLELVSRRNNHNNRKYHSSFGIGVRKNVNKYVSVIRINKKKTNLGQYSTPEKAHSKYLEVKHQLEEIEKITRSYSFIKTKINGEYFLEFFPV